MKFKLRGNVVCGLAVLVLAMVAPPVLAQNGTPIVIVATHHDVSPPLSQLVGSGPVPPQPREAEPVLPTRPLPGSDQPAGEDSVLQTLPLPLVNTTAGLNFDGVGANGSAPPDTNGSIGATQYVQITNVEFAVYNKSTGGILLGPALINSVWNGFGGACSNGNGGDPVVLWDKAAQRWVISQLASTYRDWCMAVSQTSDATGSYYRYAFNYGSYLPDYPKLGVWSDAYYWSANMFLNGNSFSGANACAFNRTSMLSGGSASAICFQQNGSVASLLPSDIDGNTAPPSGEPAFFLELATTSSLGLFKFHVDFTNPSNSTFTGPTTISVPTFSEACGGGTCIPQSGTTQQLDSLGDRLMFRLAYRNSGSTESLLVTHSVTAGSVTGTRWYEIRSPNGTPNLYQSGTFAPDSTYRWMGSIAMDQAGDIALGYSASSSSINPAVRYTGRVPSDPSGSMESEASIIEGTGSQTSGLSRWGDYSSMSIDPTDDCTFWYTNEYLTTNGSFNWHTRIGSFKFTSCGSTTPDFTLSASPGSQTVKPGQSTTYTATVTAINGFSGTVGLTVSGCPANTTCTLNPTSLNVPPAGNSTLTAQTTASTAPGTYTLTVTGTSGSLTHSTTVTLVVTNPTFRLTVSPSSQRVKRGSSTTYTATVTPSGGFNGVVTFSVSGLPSNSTGSFNPTSVTGSGSSTLTVRTTTSTPTGTFTLTVKGTSGSLVKTATVTLTVTRH